ncbi:hypothetical protein A3709_19000 [Halioglobus sp. HI00S01]|uniref:hypothetical protein n=1 Tax=Halioglobus sp. HI00S01 TaxID=1822214 RepID=UPI0007C21127|nr:hypothetical protein [Halioglobus sp. HI00S01]KZX57713.1 hypothetical protein A3709_19000 [Halioglobus sp. HI00S01]
MLSSANAKEMLNEAYKTAMDEVVGVRSSNLFPSLVIFDSAKVQGFVVVHLDMSPETKIFSDAVVRRLVAKLEARSVVTVLDTFIRGVAPASDRVEAIMLIYADASLQAHMHFTVGRDESNAAVPGDASDLTFDAKQAYDGKTHGLFADPFSPADYTLPGEMERAAQQSANSIASKARRDKHLPRSLRQALKRAYAQAR